jgi:hypothetical protein
LVGLNPQWLKELIGEGKIQLSHVGGLLTAPTKDLQELVLKYADDPEASKAEGPEGEWPSKSTLLEFHRAT